MKKWFNHQISWWPTCALIHAWEDSIETKPILHAVNQTAMQIAWIMGYFAYMDQEKPTKYLEFGLPLVKIYEEAGERIPNKLL